jgi:hypothetical protein
MSIGNIALMAPNPPFVIRTSITYTHFSWVLAKKTYNPAQSLVTHESTMITKNRRVSKDLTGFQGGA